MATTKAWTKNQEPMGLTDIAEMIGKTKEVVRGMHHRKLLPTPDGVASGNPIWARGKILDWQKAREAEAAKPKVKAAAKPEAKTTT